MPESTFSGVFIATFYYGEMLLYFLLLNLYATEDYFYLLKVYYFYYKNTIGNTYG